jgi:hypothetical protein
MRIGEDSVAREVYICDAQSVKAAESKIKEFEKQRQQMIAAGYPWRIEDVGVDIGANKKYYPYIYDEYYIRLNK